MSDKGSPTIPGPLSGQKMVFVHVSFPFDDSWQFLVNFRNSIMFVKVPGRGSRDPTDLGFGVFGGLKVSYF